MTKKQRSGVSFYLWLHSYLLAGEAHHGDCIGADAEFHRLAIRRGLEVIKHPASGIGNQRAYCLEGIELKAKPPLIRNHDIVDSVDVMIAAPGEDHEILRSGTWATIRYARKSKHIKLHIVLPL